MGFHINKKVADKKAATGTKTTFQGGSSQFIAKANTKSTGCLLYTSDAADE